VADACSISREEQDEFALQSQLKCAHAMSLGHFDAEIEPIVISTPKGMLTIIISARRRLSIQIFHYFFSCLFSR
jgi:acetyl-CoA acetyltransferase